MCGAGPVRTHGSHRAVSRLELARARIAVGAHPALLRVQAGLAASRGIPPQGLIRPAGGDPASID